MNYIYHAVLLVSMVPCSILIFWYLFLPKVKGTDCATYLSCDDQSHLDMAPESYHGVRRTTEMVQKPMADFRQYSTNRRPRDLGNLLFLSFWLMEFCLLTF